MQHEWKVLHLVYKLAKKIGMQHNTEKINRRLALFDYHSPLSLLINYIKHYLYWTKY